MSPNCTLDPVLLISCRRKHKLLESSWEHVSKHLHYVSITAESAHTALYREYSHAIVSPWRPMEGWIRYNNLRLSHKPLMEPA